MEETEQNSESQQKATTTAGLVYFGSAITGIIGIFGALMGMSGDLDSGGLYLLAAAFAFGLLANAVYRN